MASAHDVAKYFLSLIDEDAGDTISNLKLQKLVYYAQGFHLALFDRPLFNEEVKAWMHGPVVPDLYHEYKIYGSNAIPMPDDFDVESITYQHNYMKVLEQTKDIENKRINLHVEITPPGGERNSLLTDEMTVKMKDGEELIIKCRGFY